MGQSTNICFGSFLFGDVFMDRRQQVKLTNMCLIYDDERILVEEKTGI